MKNFKTGKLLAAAAAGAVMMAGVTAQADTVTFTPGGGFGSIQIDQMIWSAYNNDGSSTWTVFQDTPTPQSTFNETFTFALQATTAPPTVFGNSALGTTNTNTFVSMVVSLTGSYGPINSPGALNGVTFDPTVHDAVHTNLIYDAGGTMTMFFHADGDAGNCSGGEGSAACGDGAQIAIFDVLSGTGSRSSDGTGNNTDLNWEVELRNDITNLAFTDENGNDFDPAAQIVLAVTDQATVASNANFDVVLSSVENGLNGRTTFVVNAVPEPGMLGLFGLGLLGLGVAANRRKSKQAAA